MKIIEALKKIKQLKIKCSDLNEKVRTYCADLDNETPYYPDQRAQIREWVQSYNDSTKEIVRLNYCLQRTNLETMVTIELESKNVTKSIFEWILRRKEYAKMDENIWRSLTDKGLREENKYQTTQNAPVLVVKRRLYFDPVERDKKVELYRTEPSKIDSTLEIINAITDLKE